MTSDVTRDRFTRRAMLRGLGVSMALPWMESLNVWADEPLPSRAGSDAPVRFACLFSGNGFHKTEWTAQGTGSQMKLGKVLESLAPWRKFERRQIRSEVLISGVGRSSPDRVARAIEASPRRVSRLRR